jgi:hypothetical protein
MPIPVQCECGYEEVVPDSYARGAITCPQCSKTIKVGMPPSRRDDPLLSYGVMVAIVIGTVAFLIVAAILACAGLLGFHVMLF